MSATESIRSKVARLTQVGEFGLALAYVDSKLARLQRSMSSESAIMEVRVVRAEILQKLGWLEECRIELQQVLTVQLTPPGLKRYLMIRAKLLLQLGEIRKGAIALAHFADRRGDSGKSDIDKTYLWRSSFASGVLGDRKIARKLSDQHAEVIIPGGFHEANNVIYTQIVPALALDGELGFRRKDWLESIRRASDIYVSSDIDFAGRVGHRGKSLCQALLVEAFLLWALKNKFDAYRLGFVAALLLAHWNLDVMAEGVGELVGALGSQADDLVAVIRIVAAGRSRDAEPYTVLARAADSSLITAALGEAVEVVSEVLASSQLADIYDHLR